MRKIIYITLGFILSIVTVKAQMVGINKNKDLRAAVDVNGGVSLQKVPEANKDLPRLAINEKTRKLTYYNFGDLMTILKLNIDTTYKEDWIYDFDTKIPVSRYTPVILDAIIGNKSWNNDTSGFPKKVIYGISHTYRNSDRYGDEVFNMDHKIEFFIPENSETWHLRADYPFVSPRCINTTNTNDDCNGDFYWQITTLVINKKFVGDLGTFTTDSSSAVSTSIIDKLIKGEHS